MALLGIDISNNNPKVDFVGARQQGVLFAMGKASQGWVGGTGGWLDWTFVDIVNRARAAGVLPGAYHWMLKGNGALQAHTFLQSLQRVGGPNGILCAIDCEATSWTKGVIYDPTVSVDPQTINEFLAEWDRITNRHPIMIYGASWYHDGYMHAGAAWPTRPLWWAGYTGVGSTTIGNAVTSVTPNYISPFGGWTSYVIRQFTDNVVVPAQGGGVVVVDANVSYLSWASLVALTLSGSNAPTGVFNMDAQAEAAFAALTKTVEDNSQQLVTCIQGVPAGKPNPFGIIGNRDLGKKMDALLAAQNKTNALLQQAVDLLGKK